MRQRKFLLPFPFKIRPNIAGRVTPAQNIRKTPAKNIHAEKILLNAYSQLPVSPVRYFDSTA